MTPKFHKTAALLYSREYDTLRAAIDVTVSYRHYLGCTSGRCKDKSNLVDIVIILKFKAAKDADAAKILCEYLGFDSDNDFLVTPYGASGLHIRSTSTYTKCEAETPARLDNDVYERLSAVLYGCVQRILPPATFKVIEEALLT